MNVCSSGVDTRVVKGYDEAMTKFVEIASKDSITIPEALEFIRVLDTAMDSARRADDWAGAVERLSARLGCPVEEAGAILTTPLSRVGATRQRCQEAIAIAQATN